MDTRNVTDYSEFEKTKTKPFNDTSKGQDGNNANHKPSLGLEISQSTVEGQRGGTWERHIGPRSWMEERKEGLIKNGN